MRERRRREARARIVEIAMGLFLDRGYGVVTIDEIAAVAEISKRNCVGYFPSKGQVVEGWHDEFDDEPVSAIADRPSDESPAAVIEAALRRAIAVSTSGRSIALDRLLRETPALQARHQLKYSKLEARVADARAAPAPGADGLLQARLLAVLSIGRLLGRPSVPRLGRRGRDGVRGRHRGHVQAALAGPARDRCDGAPSVTGRWPMRGNAGAPLFRIAESQIDSDRPNDAPPEGPPSPGETR